MSRSSFPSFVDGTIPLEQDTRWRARGSLKSQRYHLLEGEAVFNKHTINHFITSAARAGVVVARGPGALGEVAGGADH